MRTEDYEDVSDSDDAKGTGGFPRRSIQIAFIRDKQKRHISFSKRKAGIFKKAHELATLTGTQILLLIVSETGLVYTYTTEKLQPLVTAKEGQHMIQNCLAAEQASLSPLSEPPQTPPTMSTPDDPLIYSPHGMTPLALPPSELTKQALGDQASGMPRSLKKRRTVDNLKSKGAALLGDEAPRIDDVVASNALIKATETLALADWMHAYQARERAESDSSTQDMSALASAFSHLMLSIQTCPAKLNSGGMEAIVQDLDHLMADFVHRYLRGSIHAVKVILESSQCTASAFPPGQVQVPSLASATECIQKWIRWLFEKQIIDATSCGKFLRQLCPSKARRIASNSRLRRTASNNVTQRAEASSATAAIRDYAKHVHCSYPVELFDGDPLRGTFIVLHISATFVVLESSTGHTPDSNSSLGADASDIIKLHLPAAVTLQLHLGDRLSLTVQRLLGDPSTAYWLPKDCSGVEDVPITDNAAMPTTQEIHVEMQRAQAEDDQIAFAEAYARWQKARLVELLVAQGELPGDSYAMPNGVIPLGVIDAQSPPRQQHPMKSDSMCFPPLSTAATITSTNVDDDDALWVLN